MSAKRIASASDSALANAAEGGLRPRDITFDLRGEIAEMAEHFSLEKVKIFSEQGEVIYSTSQEDIGTRNDKEYFHTIVLRGRNFTRLVKKDAVTLEGRTVQKDVVESYTPIWYRDSVVGAFEIYYDISVLKGLLAGLVHRSTIIIYGVSLVLLTALLVSLRKMCRNMTARQEAELALARHRDQLEILVSQRTEELTKANQQMKEDLRRIQAAEKAKFDSEEKYSVLVELAGDAIFVADAETGIITDVNKVIEEKTVRNLKRPNNVDVEYGLMLKGRPVDIAVATEREANKIRVFSLPDIKPIDSGGIEVFAGEADRAPMGIALYKRQKDGAIYAIVSRMSGPTDGYLGQYLLQDDGKGGVKGAKVRAFGLYSGKKEIESIAVDDKLGYVYYSDEQTCVRKYHADPDKQGAEEQLGTISVAGYLPPPVVGTMRAFHSWSDPARFPTPTRPGC